MSAQKNKILACPLCPPQTNPLLKIPLDRGKIKVKCQYGHQFFYDPAVNEWSTLTNDKKPISKDAQSFSLSAYFGTITFSAIGLLALYFKGAAFFPAPMVFWILGFAASLWAEQETVRINPKDDTIGNGAGLVLAGFLVALIPSDIALFGAVFVDLLGLVYMVGWLKNPPPAGREAGVYGDAGFAYPDDIAQAGLVSQNSDEFYNGIYLGRSVNCYSDGLVSDCFLTYRGENSILTIAPAGSGKNTAAVIPTLQICKDSAFVLDLKGENWWTTRHQREQGLKQKIITLNPFNIWGEELGYDRPLTHCFNPLATLNPDALDFVTAIDGLADALIVQHVGSDGGHFDGRARDLVACVMAFVCSDPKERKAGNNNLTRVREIVSQDKAVFCAWAESAAESRIPRVRNVAASFINPLSKETDGVLSTINRQTGWLDNPHAQHFLRRSDIDFTAMKKQPVTVYLMIAPELLKTYRPLVRLIVQGFFNAMKAKISTAGNRQVLAVLDEVNQLGRLESIEQAPSIMRGYGVRVWNIFQDCNQMKQTYGDAWQSFEANADIIQIFTPNDMFTAEHISKRIGNKTAHVQTKSQSFSRNSNGANQSVSESVTPHAVPFMSPSELMGFSKDRGLVFVRNMKYPVLTARQHYYDPQEIQVFDSWGVGHLPIPRSAGHSNPKYPPDILGFERQRAAQWRKNWAQGGTDGQYWKGAPIP